MNRSSKGIGHPHTGPAVDVRGLVKRYRTGVVAVRGVSLSVRAGEMFALLGPNGAGKSTLYSVLTTLRRPTSGRALVLGHDVVRDKDAIRAAMGLVFQETALERRLTVRDNLWLMALFYGYSRRRAKQCADALLDRLGLAKVARQQVSRISGGQKRRLELARALVAEPEILFLDEATLGLDVEARQTFWSDVRSIARSGRTVFFTTHYMEEAEIADRIALIDVGKIIALESPEQLKARVSSRVLALTTDDNVGAARWLRDKGFNVSLGENKVTVVHASPAEVMPDIFKALPIKILQAEVREPSLDDVFLAMTGGKTDTPPAAAATTEEQL